MILKQNKNIRDLEAEINLRWVTNLELS